MPKLPVVRGRELIRALERDGWFITRTTGHHTMRHPDKLGSLTIPNHPSQQVSPTTLRSIFGQPV